MLRFMRRLVLGVAALAMAGCEDKAPEPPTSPPKATATSSVTSAAPTATASVSQAPPPPVDEPEVVYEGKGNLVALDAERVFVVRPGPGRPPVDHDDPVGSQELVAVPKTGGEAKVLIPKQRFGTQAFVRGDDVFFVRAPKGIAKGSLSEGTVSILATAPEAVQLTLHDDHLFWTSGHGDDPGEVSSVTIDGGDVATLVKAHGGAIEADDDNVYWTDGDCVHRYPRKGNVDTKTCDGYAVSYLVQDDDAVYASAVRPGSKPHYAVSRLDKHTLKPRVLHDFDAYVNAIALAGEYVVASISHSLHGRGEVVAIPLEGGSPRVLVEGLSDPFRLQIDERHVYVQTKEPARRVVRVPRP